MPLIASGIGVAAFFCFMFSWVELLIARTLTTTDAKPIAAIMTRTVSASGMDWGLLAAAGVLTIIPGALVIWFVRNYIAKGFALGAGVSEGPMSFSWMAWTLPTALFFCVIALLLAGMAAWEYASPGGNPRVGILRLRDDTGRPAVRFAARQRLHPSRLAGSDRTQPVVGSRSLDRLRHRRIPVV